MVHCSLTVVAAVRLSRAALLAAVAVPCVLVVWIWVGLLFGLQ